MAKPGRPAKPRDLWLAKDPFLEVLQGAMALGTNRAWAAAAVMALMGAAGCGEDEASRNPASFTTPTVPAHLEQPEEALPRPIAVEAGEGRPARRFSTDAFEPRFSILLPPRWMATERGQGAWQAWIGDDERASPGELTFDWRWPAPRSSRRYGGCARRPAWEQRPRARPAWRVAPD